MPWSRVQVLPGLLIRRCQVSSIVANYCLRKDLATIPEVAEILRQSIRPADQVGRRRRISGRGRRQLVDAPSERLRLLLAQSADPNEPPSPIAITIRHLPANLYCWNCGDVVCRASGVAVRPNGGGMASLSETGQA